MFKKLTKITVIILLEFFVLTQNNIERAFALAPVSAVQNGDSKKEFLDEYAANTAFENFKKEIEEQSHPLSNEELNLILDKYPEIKANRELNARAQEILKNYKLKYVLSQIESRKKTMLACAIKQGQTATEWEQAVTEIYKKDFEIFERAYDSDEVLEKLRELRDFKNSYIARGVEQILKSRLQVVPVGATGTETAAVVYSRLKQSIDFGKSPYAELLENMVADLDEQKKYAEDLEECFKNKPKVLESFKNQSQEIKTRYDRLINKIKELATKQGQEATRLIEEFLRSADFNMKTILEAMVSKAQETLNNDQVKNKNRENILKGLSAFAILGLVVSVALLFFLTQYWMYIIGPIIVFFVMIVILVVVIFSNSYVSIPAIDNIAIYFVLFVLFVFVCIGFLIYYLFEGGTDALKDFENNKLKVQELLSNVKKLQPRDFADDLRRQTVHYQGVTEIGFKLADYKSVFNIPEISGQMEFDYSKSPNNAFLLRCEGKTYALKRDEGIEIQSQGKTWYVKYLINPQGEYVFYIGQDLQNLKEIRTQIKVGLFWNIQAIAGQLEFDYTKGPLNAFSIKCEGEIYFLKKEKDEDKVTPIQSQGKTWYVKYLINPQGEYIFYIGPDDQHLKEIRTQVKADLVALSKGVYSEHSMLSDEVAKELMWQVLRHHSGNQNLECGYDTLSAALYMRGITRADGAPFTMPELRKYIEKEFAKKDIPVSDFMTMETISMMFFGEDKVKGKDYKVAADKSFDSYWISFCEDMKKEFNKGNGPIVLNVVGGAYLVYGYEESGGEISLKIMDPHADFNGMNQNTAILKWTKAYVKAKVALPATLLDGKIHFTWITMPEQNNPHWNNFSRTIRLYDRKVVDPKKDTEWTNLYKYLEDLMNRYGNNEKAIFQTIEQEMAQSADDKPWKQELAYFRAYYLKGNDSSVRLISKEKLGKKAKGVSGKVLAKLDDDDISHFVTIGLFDKSATQGFLKWSDINLEEEAFKAKCEGHEQTDFLWQQYKATRESWENVARYFLKVRMKNMKEIFANLKPYGYVWENFHKIAYREVLDYLPKAHFGSRTQTGIDLTNEKSLRDELQPLVELNGKLTQRLTPLLGIMGWDIDAIRVVNGDTHYDFKNKKIYLSRRLFEPLTQGARDLKLEQGFINQIVEEFCFHEFVHDAVNKNDLALIKALMAFPGTEVNAEKWQQVEKAFGVLSQVRTDNGKDILEEALVMFITHNHYWLLGSDTKKAMAYFKDHAGDAFGFKRDGAPRTMLGNLRGISGAQNLPLDAFVYIAICGMDGKVMQIISQLVEMPARNSFEYIVRLARIKSLVYENMIEAGLLNEDAMQGVVIGLNKLLGSPDFHEVSDIVKSEHRDYLVESLAWAMLKKNPKFSNVIVPQINISFENIVCEVSGERKVANYRQYQEYLQEQLGEEYSDLIPFIFTQDERAVNPNFRNAQDALNKIRFAYSKFGSDSGNFMQKMDYGILLVDPEQAKQVSAQDFQSISRLEWAA